jgi:hypothetical protein
MSIRSTRFYVVLLFTILFRFSNAAVLSGTYTIPGTVAGTTVNNLTDLTAVLTGNSISGQVIFEFTSSYTSASEVYPILFTAFTGSGNVVIRPAASVSSPLLTSGTTSSVALIDLAGVTHLTFDGRPGGTGSSQLWTFQNTTASGTLPTFLFINGAAYDTLEYLTILASGTSITATVLFSTSTVAGGNSYDVVQNCNVGNYTAGNPYNPVYSNGTAGANANSHNSILNNNIYNYKNNTSGSPSAGINIGSTGNAGYWTVSGNSLYSTINYLTLGSGASYGIYFNSNSAGNVITGNYIGGQSPQCGGAAWQIPSYQANGYADFDGIYVATGAGNSISVTNNTIQNIYMASKYGSSTFRGINIVSGKATVRGNMIGSAITGKSILSGLYGTMMGIHHQATDSAFIDNNVVANFTSNGQAFVSGTSSTTTGVTIGIYGNSSSTLGAAIITNNQVFNFSRVDNYNNNLYFPVTPGSGSSTYPIGGYYQDPIAGICIQSASSTGMLISKNIVYNLYDSLSGGTSKIYINGIVGNVGSGNLTVNGNLVYNLWALDNFGNSGNYYGVTGIYLPGSTANSLTVVTNNIVRLGYKTNGTSLQNALISGIWDNTGSNNATHKVRIYHNSVYIGGTNTNQFSNNLPSFALRRDFSFTSAIYDSVVFKNNILVNNRSTTSGTAKNYGLYLYSTTNAISDYNEIYGTGTNYMYGNVGGSDYSSMAVFRATVTGFEQNSINTDPLFVSPTTVTPDLHIQSSSPADQAGTATTTLTYDYDSVVRANSSPVDIGATVACSTGTPASVSLQASQNNICAGTQVTFTATSPNGGSNPQFNFLVNGNSVQNGSSATYSSSGLLNGDSVNVILTSNANCVSPLTATSDAIYMAVTNPTTTPTVTLSPSSNNICSGTTIAFTAAATNGGAAPTFNFFKNGSSVQNSANATYSSSTLNNNDSVWVVLTSNATCLLTNTATSIKVYMNVTPTVTPAIGALADATSICSGTTVNFHGIPPVNPGNAPVYHWIKNNSIVGASQNTYSDNSLVNGDVVQLQMISNAACANPDTVLSNAITITVTTSITPTVSITSDASGIICAGTTVTFTANPNGGGNSPAYLWRKNGINTGISTSTYADNALTSGDAISVRLTSSASCANPDTANSNAISLTITPTTTPAVTITASPSATVCQGEAITFTANPVNGGAGPTYQWKKNTNNVSGTGNAYSSSSLATGDTITVVITSNVICASPSAVTSNKIGVTVNPTAVTSQNISICSGASYSFNGQSLTQTGNYADTLSTTLGCDSIINLHLTVSNAVTYSFSQSICNGDSYNFNGDLLAAPGIYHDTLQASGSCDSIVTLTLSLYNTPTTQLSDSVCEGSIYNFGGQQLTAAGTYYDTLQTVNGCDSIIALSFSLHAKPAPVASITTNYTLSTTTFTTYQWLLNGAPINGATSVGYVATQNGDYAVLVTDNFGCSDTSNTITVTTLGIGNALSSANFTIYPNPTTGELNINVSGMDEVLNIDLLDIYGRLIKSFPKRITGGLSQLQLNELAAGTYLLQFKNDHFYLTRRFELIR